MNDIKACDSASAAFSCSLVLQSTRDETIRAIRGCEVNLPDFMSDGLRDFIAMALHKTPETRVGVMDLLQHPWIKAHAR